MKTKVLNKRHNIDLESQSQGKNNIKEKKKGLSNLVLNTNFQNQDTKKFFKNSREDEVF